MIQNNSVKLFYIFNIVISFFFGIIIVLFAGSGHGSFTPITILGGWSKVLVDISFKVGIESSFIILIIPAIILGIYTYVGIQTSQMRFPFFVFYVLPFLHFFGSLISLKSIEHGHLVTKSMIDSSVVISIMAILAYWMIFYKFLSKMILNHEEYQTNQLER